MLKYPMIDFYQNATVIRFSHKSLIWLMVGFYILSQLILPIKASVPEYKGYIYSGQTYLSDLKNMYLYSTNQIILQNSTSLFVVDLRNLSIIKKQIAKVNVSDPAPVVSISYQNKQIHFTQKGKLKTFKKNKDLPQTISLDSRGYDSPFVVVQNKKIYYMSFMNMRLFMKDIDTGYVNMGPYLKDPYSSSVSSRGGQMGFNEKKKLIAICDSPQFMIVDFQMNVIQKQKLSTGNIFQLKFTQAGTMIQLGFVNNYVIKIINQSGYYESAFQFNIPVYNEIIGIYCKQVQLLCIVIHQQYYGSKLINYTIDLNKKSERLIAKLDKNKSYSKMINQSKMFISFNRYISQVEIVSIQNSKFQTILKFNIRLNISQSNIFTIDYSDEGKYLVYSIKDNDTKSIGIWDIYADQFVCSDNLSSIIGSVNTKFYNNTVFIYSIYSVKIYLINLTDCQILAQYSVSQDQRQLEGVYFLQDTNKLYVKITLDNKTNIIKQLSMQSLQTIKTFNDITTQRQIVVIKDQIKRILGVKSNNGNVTLVLYNFSSSTLEQTVYQIVCSNLDGFYAGANLSTFRLYCNYQSILINVSNFEMIHNFFIQDRDFYYFNRIQTFKNQLILDNFQSLFISQNQLAQRTTIDYSPYFQNQRYFDSLNILIVNQTVFIGLMLQKITNQLYLTKIAVQQSNHKETQAAIKQIQTIKIGNRDQILTFRSKFSKSCDNNYFQWSYMDSQYKYVLKLININTLEILQSQTVNQPPSNIIKQMNYESNSNSMVSLSYYLDCNNILYNKNSSGVTIKDLGLQLTAIKSQQIIKLGTAISSQNNGTKVIIQGQNQQLQDIIQIWDSSNMSFLQRHVLPSTNPTDKTNQILYSPGDKYFAILRGQTIFLFIDNQFRQFAQGITKFYFSTNSTIIAQGLNGDISTLQISDKYHQNKNKKNVTQPTIQIKEIQISKSQTNINRVNKKEEGLKLSYSNMYVDPTGEILIGQTLLSNQGYLSVNKIIKSSKQIQQLQRLKRRTDLVDLDNKKMNSQKKTDPTVSIIATNEAILVLNSQSGLIQTWYQSQCSNDKVLVEGVCQCPKQSQIDQKSGRCICQIKLKDMVDKSCQCPSYLIDVESNCCPTYSIDFIDGTCVCEQNYVVSNFECICPQGFYQDVQRNCLQCSFLCRSCYESGFLQCHQLSYWAWIIIALISLAVVVLILLAVYLLKKKYRHKMHSDLLTNENIQESLKKSEQKQNQN